MQSLFIAEKEQNLGETNFLDFAPSAHRNMSWDTLSPYEIPALREYLTPYLGAAFVAEIVAYANRDEAVDPVDKKEDALHRLRLALASYMMLDAFIDQNVQLTDLGPQQQSASDGGSNQPSQWAYKNKVWHLMRKADQYIDQLLDFLEEDARAQDTIFESYADDANRRRQASDFFSSTTEVDEYLNIEGSRRAWANMVPSFRDAEWLHLRPVLGDAFYTELVNSYKTGTSLSETHDQVLKLVHRAGAKYGLMIAIPNLSCVIQGDGLVIVSRRDGFDERVSSGLVYNQAAVVRLQQNTEGLARTSLADLRDYIYRNADDLPTYKNSPAYPVAATPKLPIGDCDSGAIFL